MTFLDIKKVYPYFLSALFGNMYKLSQLVNSRILMHGKEVSTDRQTNILLDYNMTISYLQLAVLKLSYTFKQYRIIILHLSNKKHPFHLSILVSLVSLMTV